LFLINLHKINHKYDIIKLSMGNQFLTLGRIKMNKQIYTMLLAATLALTSISTASAGVKQELINDIAFKTGINLQNTDTKAPKVVGKIKRATDADTDAMWRLAQWGSIREQFGAPVVNDKQTCWSNIVKRVCINTKDDGNVEGLSLNINSITEWNNKYRTKDQFWPHLLLAQTLKFDKHKAIGNLKSLTFETAFKMPKKTSIEDVSRGYDSNIHATQLLATMIIQNRVKGSVGHGEYFWFVMPMYDSRYDIAPANVKIDRDKQKFLWIMSQGDVMSTSPKKSKEGTRHYIKYDALPEIKKALQTAITNGVLTNKDFSVYNVTSLSIGFEAPGMGIHSVDFDKLRLTAKLKD
jgi:hypothetical protein